MHTVVAFWVFFGFCLYSFDIEIAKVATLIANWERSAAAALDDKLVQAFN